MSVGVGPIITEVSTVQQCELGAKLVYGGKAYRYIKNVGATSLAANMSVVDNADTPYQVTCIVVSAKRQRGRGIAVSTIAQNSFGWVQTSGDATGDIVSVAGGLTSLGVLVYPISNATGHLGYQATADAPIAVEPIGSQNAAVASGGTTMSITLALDEAD